LSQRNGHKLVEPENKWITILIAWYVLYLSLSITKYLDEIYRFNQTMTQVGRSEPIRLERSISESDGKIVVTGRV
jgi:hypothetical protein